MRMLDLFCGRGGWTNAFLERGWECVGVDLVKHPEYRGRFEFGDVLRWDVNCLDGFDFVCASSPCEQFSIHGMRMFHKDPPYPAMGIRLFNHTREICELSERPYVMENVRAAQDFVGKSRHNCGPFHLWGNGVPPLMPQGIRKGMDLGSKMAGMDIEQKRIMRKNIPMLSTSSGSEARKRQTAAVATIPPELAACVADYAERICRGV